MMQILDTGTGFQVTIEFDQWFRRNVAAVKAIPGARWIHDQKFWHLPGDCRLDVEAMAHTCKASIHLPQAMRPELTGAIGELPIPAYPVACKGQPRPYQLAGIGRILDLRRCIVGDEMGLGKTMQTITAINTAAAQGQDVFPCLIICPATLRENWLREWKMWTDRRVMVLSDAVRNTWPQFWKTGMIDVFIVNYESLKKYFVESMPAKGRLHSSKDIVMKPTIDLLKSVIVDESHRTKNSVTLQSRLTLRICHKKEWVIELTGTPVTNRPIELFTQLAIINQHRHFGGGKKKDFIDRYCFGPRKASNLKELNYLLNQHCFFRREKRDVAKDLPDKQRQQIICDITTREEYSTAENDFIRFLRNAGNTEGQIDHKLRAEALVKIGALRQISARGKIAAVREFVEEIMDAGEKLILFCNLKAIVQEMKALFPKAVTVTGDDSTEQRQRNIDAFQSKPECQLIICNIKAAGVGITLTASSRVAFIEYPWTYADCVQCEDRAHRIGQKNAVMCTYFLGNETIDEKMLAAILTKKEIANAITGGTDEMEMDVIDNIINLFNNPKAA